MNLNSRIEFDASHQLNPMCVDQCRLYHFFVNFSSNANCGVKQCFFRACKWHNEQLEIKSISLLRTGSVVFWGQAVLWAGRPSKSWIRPWLKMNVNQAYFTSNLLDWWGPDCRVFPFDSPLDLSEVIPQDPRHDKWSTTCLSSWQVQDDMCCDTISPSDRCRWPFSLY